MVVTRLGGEKAVDIGDMSDEQLKAGSKAMIHGLNTVLPAISDSIPQCRRGKGKGNAIAASTGLLHCSEC